MSLPDRSHLNLLVKIFTSYDAAYEIQNIQVCLDCRFLCSSP